MKLSITPKADRVLVYCHSCKRPSGEIAQALTKAGHGFLSLRRREPTERELTERAARMMGEQGLPERARKVLRLVLLTIRAGTPNGEAPLTIKQYMRWLDTRSAWVATKALSEAKAAGWLKIKTGSRGVGKGRAVNLHGVSWLPQGYREPLSTARTCTESVAESVAESVGQTESVGLKPLKSNNPASDYVSPPVEDEVLVPRRIGSSTSSRRHRPSSVGARERSERVWRPCCMECVEDCVKSDECGRLKAAGLR
jgi:hypothetical protein